MNDLPAEGGAAAAAPQSTLPLTLPLASPDATLETVGGKGASLSRLATAGLPVPTGFHVTTAAYRRFVAENGLERDILAAASGALAESPASLDAASERIASLFLNAPVPTDIADAVRAAYGALGAGDPAVAVRSSATAEDLPEMSFAGQQETYLNIRGAAAVLDAVRRCWASLWTARAIGYRARNGIAPEDVSLAVVVQQLVPAEAAGILFTANPVSGSRDELVISAAWGLGEAIVGGLVTPDTLTANKASGEVVSAEIADKDVMTVRTAEGTREEPVPEVLRRQATLKPDAVPALVKLGVWIETLYGQPMDIEWAWHNERFDILQARPITALPEARPVLDWTIPREGGKYARSSVIELLPDPVSPLFETLALPLWNDAMSRLLSIFGDWFTFQQALVTINGYAFYDFGMTNRQAMSMMVGFFTRWRPLLSMLQRSEARWAEEGRPRYVAAVATGSALDVEATPAVELLAATKTIVATAADHYLSIQSGLLPIAYISEALYSAAYERLARRKGDPPALTFMLGYDSAPIQAEKDLYDIATWVKLQADLTRYLAETPSAEIAKALGLGKSPSAGPADDASADRPAPLADVASWTAFRRRFGEHLDRYGHVVYDLDFMKSLPVDDPGPLLEALKFFVTGQARSPYERQATAAAAREAATQGLLDRSKGLRRRLFGKLLPWAQRYAPLREDGLADVGLGWPLVRRIWHEVGGRLVKAGAIEAPEDIYWLTWDELQAAARSLDAGQPVVVSADAVAARRARWEVERRVTPPVVLPPKTGATFLGMDFSRFMPAHTTQVAGNTIKGIGASPGEVTGRARVIHGPAEFGRMAAGDILVTKITTPAWTPLFALAAGIVTDVGGPLSHSSIVAREYHIPAVLGTGIATERIADESQVSVDGDKGEVRLGA